jgi:hypothetical protein
MQEPSGLVRRSVVHPTPLWTWSLVWRNGEDNPAVRAVIDEFTRDAGELGWMTRGRGCRPQIRIGARESAQSRPATIADNSTAAYLTGGPASK